eukprot:1081492-Amorphochlora_amoeboformis.AAC.1
MSAVALLGESDVEKALLRLSSEGGGRPAAARYRFSMPLKSRRRVPTGEQCVSDTMYTFDDGQGVGCSTDDFEL